MTIVEKRKNLSKAGYSIAKNYNPPFDYPDGTKFYTNPEMDVKIDKLLENCALKKKNKCEINFKEAINKINNIKQNKKKRWCFIAGGVIRDIMHDLQPKDVDLKFTFISKKTLDEKCKQWSWPCISVYGTNDTWSYIKFMEDQPGGFEGLEGMSFHKKYALRFFENNVNALMYDVENKVFVAKRIDNPKNFWQMPQGGVDRGEDYLTAAYRELEEETSIKNVDLIKELDGLISYELPKNLLGVIWKGKYRGQEQKWFVMRFLGKDTEINIKTEYPEFCEWKWIDLENITDLVVDFKLHVYVDVKKKVKEIIS